MSGLPQVLLVEDDPSIRRFVSMALEGLPVRLSTAANLAEARSLLGEWPFSLVILDLMLPDGSGLDLLQQMFEQHPEWRGKAELAVFSAGFDEATRTRLKHWGVHRILAKPISLADLERHVLECIQPAQVMGDAASTSSTAILQAARQQAIDTFFGGDAPLFDAFAQACRLQFAQDVEMADAAVEANDLATLRRVVHSLKTVLLTLGHPDLSALAARAEAAAADLVPEAVSLWHQLRADLLPLVDPSGR